MKATTLSNGFKLECSYSPHVEGLGRTESLEVEDGKLLWIVRDGFDEDKITEVSDPKFVSMIQRQIERMLSDQKKHIEDLKKSLARAIAHHDKLTDVIADLNGMVNEEKTVDMYRCS